MAHSYQVKIKIYFERHIRAKFGLKVFGKGFGDDSPWDGEMSEGQRGQVPVRENLFQKGFPQ